MRVVSHIISLFLLLLAGIVVNEAADAGKSGLRAADGDAGKGGARERVTVQAILVIASDEGTTDRSLAGLEANLRSVLRFKAYRRAGGGSATIDTGESASISLSGGQRLEVTIKEAWDDQVMAGIRWWNGDLTLANTTMQRPRKKHTVLAGPATADGSGHYAVIIVMD